MGEKTRRGQPAATGQAGPVMGIPLGALQRRLLHAVRRHGSEASLESLAALAAGLIQDLGARPPQGRAPTRSQYVAVARAVASLRRRGLVEARIMGTAKGRLLWPRSASARLRPVWRFVHPGKRLLVRPVDSLSAKS